MRKRKVIKPAVISLGNAYDGLTLVGPFPSAQHANGYADEYYTHDEWHVVELEKVEDPEFFDDDEQ